MPYIEWLSELGASPVDILLLVIILALVGYVLRLERRRNGEVSALWAENKLMREEQKELQYRYSQLDKLTFGIAIAIQKKTGIKLVKQSANSAGDNALNRDVE